MRKVNIKKAGYNFGTLCKVIGAIGAFISIFLIPNDLYESVNVIGLKVFLVFIGIFIYGKWRTGGKGL